MQRTSTHQAGQRPLAAQTSAIYNLLQRTTTHQAGQRPPAAQTFAMYNSAQIARRLITQRTKRCKSDSDHDDTNSRNTKPKTTTTKAKGQTPKYLVSIIIKFSLQRGPEHLSSVGDFLRDITKVCRRSPFARAEDLAQRRTSRSHG